MAPNSSKACSPDFVPALLTALVAGFVPMTAVAAPTDPVDVASITPNCADPFDISKDKASCVPNPMELAELKAENGCTAVLGTAWNGRACVADGDMSKFPKPSCGTAIPNLVYNAEKKACQVVSGVPRSAQGDYVGDCFKIVSGPPDGLKLPLPQRTHWKVVSQSSAGSTDKELVLAPAEPVQPLWGAIGTIDCTEMRGTEQRVPASSLIATGAHRYGWAYGVLTLPFKYHRHNKTFTPGAVSIGPYLGRRWGSAGSAVTAAATATIGSVRGEVRDAQNNITDTPDLTAFSWALGLMVDVSKNPELKPFKLGLFWGSDRVNQSDAIRYPHNRKHWLAFQIGYDFTDN
jgi:hypothetical protein